MQTDLITKVYFNEHLTHSCVGMPQGLQALLSSCIWDIVGELEGKDHKRSSEYRIGVKANKIYANKQIPTKVNRMH